MQKQIFLVTAAAIAIVLSCVAVGFAVNYFVNREQPLVMPVAARTDILPQINTTKNDVQVEAGEPASQTAIQVKEPEDKQFIEERGSPQSEDNYAPLVETEEPSPAGEGLSQLDSAAQIPAEPVKVPSALMHQLPIVAVSSTVAAEPPAGVSTMLPPFTPVTNTSGPVPPPSTAGIHAAQRSPADFAPMSNATGPVSPNASEQKPLPPFTPITNITGPVKADDR